MRLGALLPRPLLCPLRGAELTLSARPPARPPARFAHPAAPRPARSASTPLEILLELRRHAPHLLSSPSKLTIVVDGGIRRGTDVVKALCLGAHAVSLARPFMFSLVYGPDGVEKVARILEDEVVRAMKLLGVRSVEELGPEYVNARRVERLVYGGKL